MEQNKDLFEHKSKNWDMNSIRVRNAKEISDIILNNIDINSSMEIVDFGAGTGLLSYFIAKHVSKIIAIDNSPSMLEEFRAKQSEFACETDIIKADIMKNDLKLSVDGIISSMTMHHIEDIEALFLKLFNMLHKGGFIAIADLDSEDGTFHSDNEGVYHYGFDREMLTNIAKEAGFININFKTANVIEKPHAKFSVFTMTAQKKI
ncbi:MAG: class I SAM-dependent methyltransferase [Sulfurovaceae bacterium]|jgi:cyclopropane fatty-acyl-phospholipid synthase-like methyltransferase|nr:class I SAM-dependent methyltransferase [Sulfurovaceae bacterium]